MTKTGHYLYISILSAIVLIFFFYTLIRGFSFYETSLSERFFHPDYQNLKPSGFIGHSFGIFGSLSMLFGISIYMLRKSWRKLSRLGLLKHWLEFHIFLCTLGPVMILFHTSFKFGGIVSISFWSMIAVFLSGIIGRFIYIQIPRTIEGRELSLNEVSAIKDQAGIMLSETDFLDEESKHIIDGSTRKKIEVYKKNIVARYINQNLIDRKTLIEVKMVLRKNSLPALERKKIIKLVRTEISLRRRIERLDTMKNLFKYWHVAHLPFAFVMLLIMVIHVAVSLYFGYIWIF